MFHPFEIAFCGLSGSGKTTLVEKLIRRFLQKDYRVSCFKHGFHHFDIDRPGKDSDRFRKAGAVSVMISDSEKKAVVGRDLDSLAINQLFLDSDLLLVEGLKELPLPKLLLVDRERRILESLDQGLVTEVLALLHDGCSEGLEAYGLPLFSRDDEDGVFNFVESFFRARATAVPLHGLVLAGGLSRRMGQNKALMRFHDRDNQLIRTASLLQPHCRQVFVSCRDDQRSAYEDCGLPIIVDKYLDMGPLGGLLSAMRHDPEAAWLVAACDLPLLDEKTLADLCRQRSPFFFATAFLINGRPIHEPLATIYEPKSRQRLLLRHAAGDSSMVSFLKNSRVVTISVQEGNALLNVNDPDGTSQALSLIGGPKSAAD